MQQTSIKSESVDMRFESNKYHDKSDLISKIETQTKDGKYFLQTALDENQVIYLRYKGYSVTPVGILEQVDDIYRAIYRIEW